MGETLFALFIGLVILLALVGIAAFARRRQFLLTASEENFTRQIEPKAVSLFAPTTENLRKIEQDEHRRKTMEERERLLEWASLVEFSHLPDVKIGADKKIWADAFEILTERAHSEQDMRTLVSFALENKFNVNKNLIQSYRQIWERAPDLETTTRLFELSTLADDADLFSDVLTEARHFIKSGKLELSKGELFELAESHHWLLSQPARTSGAGFLLKQKLADLRRELNLSKK